MSPDAARVLAALRFRGANGVTRVDFSLPDVLDGGKPILNFPARIYEIKGEGHELIDAGRRNRCKVYRLLRDAQDSVPAAPNSRNSEPPFGGLFDPTRPRNAVLGWDEDAA